MSGEPPVGKKEKCVHAESNVILNIMSYKCENVSQGFAASDGCMIFFARLTKQV